VRGYATFVTLESLVPMSIVPILILQIITAGRYNWAGTNPVISPPLPTLFAIGGFHQKPIVYGLLFIDALRYRTQVPVEFMLVRLHQLDKVSSLIQETCPDHVVRPSQNRVRTLAYSRCSGAEANCRGLALGVQLPAGVRTTVAVRRAPACGIAAPIIWRRKCNEDCWLQWLVIFSSGHRCITMVLRAVL